MDLQKAQQIIGRAVENPEAPTPSGHTLALAVATVLVENGLLFKSLSSETITVVTTTSE